MTENYLSGKKRNLKLGVSGHSENSTSLQTVGGVGIGTTNADKRALYVVGNTEITGVLTATSYSGDGSGLTGVAATDHVATFDLVVAGISTFHDDVRVTAGGIDVTSGIISATQFDVGTGGIDVDGQTDLDEVVVAGVSTFSALVDANARLDVVGGANIDQLNVAGVSTFAGISTFTDGNVYIDDELFVGGVQVTGGGPIVGNDVLARHIKATGVSTFQSTLDVDGLIDADGGADIVGGVNITGGLTADSLTISGVTTGINVTGVSTFAQLDVSTGGLDVDGQTNLDEVVVAGVSTFAGNIVAATATFSGDVTVQGTLTSEDKTNIDSIGLVTARTGVRVTSGGLIVTAGVSTFSSAVDINAGLDVDGQADLDELVVAGVATFSNTVDVNASVDALNITAIGGNYTGVVTASSFSGDGSNLSGVGTAQLSSFDLVVAGISTFNDDVRILAGGLDVVSGVVSATQFDVGTGGIDVDGQTDLDELVVAGVSTFSALVDANVGANIVGGLTVDDINATGVTTIAEPSNTNTNSAWSVTNSGSSAYLFTGPGQDGSDNNSDLYLVRGQRYIFAINTGGGHPFQIRVASGGAAYNTGVTNNGASSGNIIFNVQHDAPAQLYYQCTSHSGMVGNIYIIGGPQVISGVITATAFSGDGSGLTNLEPAGLSTTSTAFFKDIVATGGVKVTGITTSGSFEGDGSSLTGIGTQGPNVQAFGIDVAGISTFHDDVRILSGGLDVVSGVATFTGIYVKDDSGNNDVIIDNNYVSNHVYISLKDNCKAQFGNGTDLQIYHDASNSYVIDQGSGDLILGANDAVKITNGAGTENKIVATTDGSVELYYNNLQKFATTAVGATVYGNSKATTLHIAGISTLTGDVNFVGNLKNVNATGISSFIQLDVSTGGIDVDGQANLDEVVVAGAATFSSSVKIDGAVDIGTGGVDIDGQTDLDELVVAGVSTFSAKAVFNTAYPSIDADNEIQVGTAIQLGKAGVITATSFSGSGANLTGIAATDHVSTFDLVVAGIATFYNDVKIVGGGSTAGNQITIGATTLNDGTLTFDGTAGQLFSISNNLTDGSIFSVNDVSGMPSIDVGAAGTIQLAPYGAGELVGIGTTRPTSKLDVVGDVQVVGVVTATSFSGSGANLTNIPASTDGSFIGLNVTGVSTLSGAVQVGSGLTVVAGISTFNDDVIFDGAYDITWDKSRNQFIFGDNAKLALGTGGGSGGDFFIWSDGSEVYFDGNANLGYPDIIFRPHNISTRPALKITNSGSAEEVQLYYTGANKLTTKTDGVGVSGILTASGINLAAGSGIEAGATGILTAVQVDVSTGGLDVDGQTDLDELVVAGVTTHNEDVSFPGATSGRDLTWDKSENELKFADQAILTFGDSDDLTIEHDGGNSVIAEAGTGKLIIKTSQLTVSDPSNNSLAEFIDGGECQLYFADVEKLNTEVGGITVAGGVNASVGTGTFFGLDIGTRGLDVDGQTDLDEVVVAGAATFSSNTYFNANSRWYDSVQLQLGDSGDLKIYHDNSTNTGNIKDETNNKLRIGARTITFHDEDLVRNYASFTEPTSGFVGVLTASGINLVAGSGRAVGATGIITAVGANITGVLTCVNPSFTNVSAIGGNYTGVVTASSFAGDGSALTGIEAGGTGDFYVGFTSSVTMNANSFEVTGHTFPSTVSKTYVIDSIMAANVSNVGVGTTVNLIASISSNSGVAAGTTEKTYIAYNVPLSAGGAVELLKEPMVANPNDIVKLWATNDAYVGIASAIQVHMTYTQQDSTDFFGKYASNTSIGSTTIIGIHTAGPTYAAALQSIHLTNRSDAGAFPVDIMLTNSTGVVTTYLVKNLVIPKYSSVEILERPKRMETGSTLGVKVQQTGTIDVVVSGKKYS